MRASFAFIIVLVCSTAFAQNVGTIAGTVKDPQGLAIPGATIVLANRVSQASQNAVSDEQPLHAQQRRVRHLRLKVSF